MADTLHSATIERYIGGPTRLTVYANGVNNPYIIDWVEAPIRDIEARMRNLYKGLVAEEVYRDGADNLVPVRVFWSNMGYYSQEEFADFKAAVAYAKSKCFEAAFHVGDFVVAGWSPIGGLRMLQEVN